MAETLRVGIIGMGMVHLTAFQAHSSAEVVAICDRDAAWLARVWETHHVPAAYSDYRELLAAPDVNAVVVALSSALHAEATITAVQAGKHVLCEKPMALNAADAQAMVSAAREAGRALMIGHHMRFPTWGQFLRRCVDEGHFGDIYLARAGWQRPNGTRGGASMRGGAVTLFGEEARAYTSVAPRLDGYPGGDAQQLRPRHPRRPGAPGGRGTRRCGDSCAGCSVCRWHRRA